MYMGRAEETEAHIGETLGLSPRYTMAYVWTKYLGGSEAPTRHLGGSDRVV
jgi:hypothetical protein